MIYPYSVIHIWHVCMFSTFFHIFLLYSISPLPFLSSLSPFPSLFFLFLCFFFSFLSSLSSLPFLISLSSSFSHSLILSFLSFSFLSLLSFFFFLSHCISYGMSGWWCSRRMTKRSSPAGSGRGRKGTSERRVQSHSTPSEAKPGSLWTCGPVQSPATTPRVCHRPPDCTRGSPNHWGVSSMIAWTFSMNSLVRVFLVVSSALDFLSTTSKGSSDVLSCALKHWTVQICILR